MQRKHMIWSIVISGLILGHGLAGRVEAGARKYYLTKDAVAGDKPLVICQKNYHMASLWEIFNMTTLTYNTQLGRTHADSGGGPPVEFGWIRTGNIAIGDATHISGNIAGKANCQAWTTASPATNGTAVELWDVWTAQSLPLVSIFPWAPGLFGCDAALPVWCIEDDD